MKIINLLLITILISGCKLQDLRKIIDFKEPRKGGKPCIVSVWPAVKSGNTKYKMTATKANRFIIDVQAATGYSSKNYRRIKASKKIPKTCNQLLWHNGSSNPKSYLSCMSTWGRNTLKGNKSCPKDGAYVVGSAITSSNGKAKILIVNLDNPKKYANRRHRYAKGGSLKRLARNMGKVIRKEIR
jgi:hypothetical protein